MHTINVPPLRKALEHVTEHPEEHAQGQWVSRATCGTVGCLAYWIVIAAGYEVRWRNATVVDQTDPAKLGESIRSAATREASLNDFQAEQLFRGTNTIDDLWNLASTFTDGEITRPHDSSSSPLSD